MRGMRLVAMPMMQVRKVRVLVGERHMTVPVTVRLARWLAA